MIPKIIHHVWVGPKPFPDQEKKFVKSWKDLHKDYDFMFWSDSNIHELDINKKCISAMQNAGTMYACKADIVRYIAVNSYGGFYIDTDVECYRPIDDIFNTELQFIGLKPHGGNWITNAFFASEANSQILNNVISGIHERQVSVKNPYGPTYLTRKLLQYLKHKGSVDAINSKFVKILSPEFWSNKNDKAYCKHYFRASWRK